MSWNPKGYKGIIYTAGYPGDKVFGECERTTPVREGDGCCAPAPQPDARAAALAVGLGCSLLLYGGAGAQLVTRTTIPGLCVNAVCCPLISCHTPNPQNLIRPKRLSVVDLVPCVGRQGYRHALRHDVRRVARWARPPAADAPLPTPTALSGCGTAIAVGAAPRPPPSARGRRPSAARRHPAVGCGRVAVCTLSPTPDDAAAVARPFAPAATASRKLSAPTLRRPIRVTYLDQAQQFDVRAACRADLRVLPLLLQGLLLLQREI
jgi:hypothetical protein